MCITRSAMRNRFGYHLWIFILWITELITVLGINPASKERVSESVSAVVKGVIKKREERGESTRKGGGGGGDRETRVTVIDRKSDEGIISQSGSEKKRAKERWEGGDGARFVGEGPGGKAKEEQRQKDLCSALPGQQSQKQEALPWQAVSKAHMQRQFTHRHTHRQLNFYLCEDTHWQ